MSRNDNILCVPIIHLWDAAAEDLLAAAGESVSAGDGASIDAPHMDVGASTGHYITLHTDTHTQGLIQFLEHFRFIYTGINLLLGFMKGKNFNQEAFFSKLVMVSIKQKLIPCQDLYKGKLTFKL